MKILLITGCFDVLHIGHIKLIEYARSICDNILIAIDSDEKVKKDKGPTRPFNNEIDRKNFLLSLKGINDVLVFKDEKELENICNTIKPEYRLVGADWKGKKIVGGDFCKEIIYFERIPGYSTTRILNKTL